jgi:uncharacterized cupin superfamily protein
MDRFADWQTATFHRFVTERLEVKMRGELSSSTDPEVISMTIVHIERPAGLDPSAFETFMPPPIGGLPRPTLGSVETWAAPDGAVETGTWEATPGTFARAIVDAEFCHFVRGHATFVTEDGHRFEFRAGDAAYFPPRTLACGRFTKRCARHTAFGADPALRAASRWQRVTMPVYQGRLKQEIWAICGSDTSKRTLATDRRGSTRAVQSLQRNGKFAKSSMFTRFTTWLNERRVARAASKAAWRDAIATAPDGLTGFERQALVAVEKLVGHLSIERSGRFDRPTLSARIPNSSLVLTLWGEDAQVHRVDGREVYRKERWDFATPQESMDDLVDKMAMYLRSNNQSKEGHTGGPQSWLSSLAAQGRDPSMDAGPVRIGRQSAQQLPVAAPKWPPATGRSRIPARWS